MNRREFFKFPAVVALLAVAPPLAKIASAADTIAIGDRFTIAGINSGFVVTESIVGFVREIIGHDIENDLMYIRWDIGDGLSQYHVSGQFSEMNSIELTNESFLVGMRDSSISVLKEYAINRGMDLTKLVRLKLPDGVFHARYV